MARGDRSKAAYRHIDLSVLPDEHRAEILSDADAGGREFGLQVVEVIHNGPAQAPIYGVYYHDEPLWDDAKKEFGIEEDGDVEKDLTDQAEHRAAEEAAAQRRREEKEIADITGDQPKDDPKPLASKEIEKPHGNKK